MYFFSVTKKNKITKRRLIDDFDNDSKKISSKKVWDQSSEDESVDVLEICDDDSDDNINDGSEVCLICEEYGKNEVWYRCTSCGLWVHADCSDADSPEGYNCDICVRELRKAEIN